ncbi:hypothetical protein NX779_03130 [Mycoplasma cottewii]|uniref:Uncharacterized protein n=1 Tax=Mycoplasma cottewii TaxID=51364 RepID=A0ABY5TWR3_9MOLU|nr:hypothetical protein [Mycoplasma cottewii]UWD34784.1 hypothetical protein NX779_03130 [Mycoplasma cottewii]
MKKLLLPMIGLIFGSGISGGTIYGVQTIMHNKEINQWRALLQEEKQNAQKIIKSLKTQLEAVEGKNRDIKQYLDTFNDRIKDNFELAKKVYKEAVKLTTHTVKDHDDKDVTYYLAYYDIQNKEIKVTEGNEVTTKLEGNKEPIPATLEALINKGIKVEHTVEGEEKNEPLTSETFDNAQKFTTMNKLEVTKKIIKDVLEKTQQGGEKLIKFFQDKLNELTKLLDDLKEIDVEDFVNLLGKIETGINKNTWKEKNTKQKLEKIKELLEEVKTDWDQLSGWVKDNLTRFEQLDKDSEEILNRLKNDTDQLPKKPEAEDGGRDGSSRPESETAPAVS